jgi:hypothetical protein
MSPKEEAQQLVDASLPFAEQLLTKYGEFFPFGRVIESDGTIAHHAGYPGGEQPPSSEVIEILQRSWRQMASNGSIRASARLTIFALFRPDVMRSRMQSASQSTIAIHIRFLLFSHIELTMAF